MPKIVLHIGTHKTGTTSIQKTLFENRAKLRRRGVWYPGYSIIGLRDHYAQLGMANALAGEHKKFSVEQASLFFKTVAAKAKDHEATFLSAEPMYRQIVRGEPGFANASDQEHYWQRRRAFVERVRSTLGDAEIVMVLRRQDDYAQTIYQEHVKVTRYAKPLKEFLRDYWFHFVYMEQYSIWKEFFSKVTVLGFDEIAGPNIAHRLLVKLGLKPGRLKDAGRFNTTLPQDLVILKRWLNDTALSEDQLAEVVSVLGSPTLTAAPGLRSHRSLFDSAEHRIAFQSTFESQNEALSLATGRTAPLFVDREEGNAPTYGDSLSDELRSTLMELTRTRLLSHEA